MRVEGVFEVLSVAVLWFTSFFTLTLSLGFERDQALQGGLIGIMISTVIIIIFVLQSEYIGEVFFGTEEDLLPSEGLAFADRRLTYGIPILLFGLAFLIFIIRQLATQL